MEERLQAIVKEIEQAGMLLYVDDIHLLFGEQSQGVDALRSILTGGAVRILGTCGWREWRRYVEPDPGLARRVAPVRIQEPDHEEALRIVEGVAPPLAGHHSVRFGDNVLDAAVSLSRRYIVGRQLPDKAIVALDSACARARMNRVAGAAAKGSGPPEWGFRRDGGATRRGRGRRCGGGLGFDRCPDRRNVVGREQYGRAARGRPSRSVSLDRTKPSPVAPLRRGAYLAGLSDRRKPVGALMFCGPSGVGKTETAHAIADVLFGGRLLTVNMSEFQEAHTVSGLKGAPAGYVGYGEGGVLTEGIRRTPYSVVLLDEIEKAHRDVIEMLYQVLDRGWMEDAEGIEADFSNALIILTTNVGDAVIERAAMADPAPFEDEFHQSLTGALARHFPAAFIGRLQIVPYWPLGEDTLAIIAGMRLDRLAASYRASHRSELEFDEGVRSWLAERVKTTPQGARFLDGIIAGSIRPVIAEHVLDRIGRELSPGPAIVCHDDGKFVVRPAAAS